MEGRVLEMGVSGTERPRLESMRLPLRDTTPSTRP